jgi:hypothetical protein
MSILCSVAALFIVTLIMNFLTSVVPDLNGLVNLMYSTAMFWLVLILTVGICMVLELIWRAWMRELYPTVVQIYQEIQRLPLEEQKKALDPAKLRAPSPSDGAGTTGAGGAPGQAPHSGFGAASAGTGAGGMPASDDHINVEYSQSHANFSGDPTHSSRHLTHGGGSARAVDGRRGSFSQMRGESARGRDKLKNNMVRAMLRFRNMTGAQFDSAAQAQLQQHDKFKTYDANGHENASPDGAAGSGGYGRSGEHKQMFSPSGVAPSPSGVNFIHGAPSPAVHGGNNSQAEALLSRYENGGSSSSLSGSHAPVRGGGQAAGGAAATHVSYLTEEDAEPKTDDRRLSAQL